MKHELLDRLRHNQRFLAEELLERGYSIEIVDRRFDLISVTGFQRSELCLDIDGSIMPFPAALICNNKFLTKKVLDSFGLRTPKGMEFAPEQLEEATCYALNLGLPVVIKPSVGISGDEVHINLVNEHEIRNAFQTLVSRLPGALVLIEEYFPGHEYRILVTRSGRHAALYREPAAIIGDGVSTIERLVDIENARRRLPEVKCLAPIILNHISEHHLAKAGMNFTSIPGKAEKVYVRPNSNVGTGGFCYDFTERLHPDVLDLSSRALKAFPGLPYAGIDFMCADAGKAQNESSYRIIEVNPLPSLGIHMPAACGGYQNAAALVIDELFPADS